MPAPHRSRGASLAGLALLAGLVAEPRPSSGQSPDEAPPLAPVPVIDRGDRAPRLPMGAEEESEARWARPRAVARVEGVVAPGLRVRLVGVGSTGGELRHRWVQTLGAPVELDQPDGPVASFIVPSDAAALGFLLIVGNPAGLDLAPVVIEVEGRAGAADAAALRADAGDDQVVAPGRQVTLNGVRSEPRGSIGYRWIQVGGPAIGPKIEDGYILTFAPTQPGLYRFALVVADGDAISEPDFVEVVVAAQAPTVASGGQAPTMPTGELARAALAEVPGGLAASAELARGFTEVADRLDLYESCGAMFQELSARVESVIPADAGLRAAWVQRFCGPVTARLAEGLRQAGLDTSHPRALEMPLSEVQKDRLEDELRAVAAGLGRLAARPEAAVERR